MGFDISTSIARQCKDSLGGVAKLYLASYVDYSPTQLEIDGVYLTDMPLTYVYEYDLEGVSFNETTSVENGATFYNQTLSFTVAKTQYDREMYKMVKKRVRAFYIDNNGIIRVAGLFNGMDANYTNQTGGQKAELNGYTVTLTGKEEEQAYFIDSLIDIGVVEPANRNYVFQSGDNFIFNDGVTNFIFN